MARQERAFKRTGLVRPATLEIDGRKFDCVVQNIARKGAKLRLAVEVQAAGEASNARLEIPDIGAFEASIAWVHGKQIGLEFSDEADIEILAEHAAANVSDVLAVLNDRKKTAED